MTHSLSRKLSLAALCLLALYGPGQASADDKPIDGMAPGQKDGKDSIRCDMRGTTPAADWQMPNQPGNLDSPQIQTSPSFQKP